MDVPRIPGALLLIVLGLGLLSAGAECTPRKKLIEFGWDEPDPSFMRRHRDQMESTPFDGCVFHLSYLRPDGSPGNFAWDVWGTRAFTEEELGSARRDLLAVGFRRFTHNFLRFNVTPGDLDWFDDHSALFHNARLAARIAREGGCPGVLFDVEQYHAPLWDYRRQREAGTRTWDEYAAQARRRGRGLIEAFEEGFPGLTVLLTYGYCLPWAQSHEGRRPLADVSYGLLAPFLDGMVEGASVGTRIVDGYEHSYGYREPRRFERAYRTMKNDLLPIVADPDRYARVFSFAFGIWMDFNWRQHGWSVAEVERNFFTPKTFEESVRAALEATDEYVWIYTETPRWWSERGAVKLPTAYRSALRRARNAGARD